MPWIAAMALPASFCFVFADTRFPWQNVLPLLLVGPMLASDKMLSRAINARWLIDRFA